jgi:hypothetical protein
MAGKADFTAEEWEALQKGVTGAAFLVAVADRGFFDTFKEAGALAKRLAEARSKSTSPLVREVAEVRGTGFGFTSSPQEIENETVQALRSAMSTLAAKAPDDASAYRDFVLDVAQSVAAAADETATAESNAIDKIKAALAT